MNSAHLPAPPVLARLFSTRGCLTLALAGAVNVGILCWMPIASGGVRAGLVGSGALAVAAAIAALRHRPRVLAAFAALVLLLCTGVATTRNRKVDTAAMRTQITLELRDHLGVAYTWGGENWRGIDCSGLPRNALRGAAIKQAITHLNGRLAIVAVDQWWHDSSAAALGEGYRSNTSFLFEADSIIAADDSTLQPGDFAITANGVHAVCYLGDHHWIHASPDAGKVIEVDARNTNDGWFKVPVKMMRWRVLENDHDSFDRSTGRTAENSPEVSDSPWFHGERKLPCVISSASGENGRCPSARHACDSRDEERPT
ncbi:MAG: NlpC/P60 family protein [Verrucomicrobiales bacterium]